MQKEYVIQCYNIINKLFVTFLLTASIVSCTRPVSWLFNVNFQRPLGVILLRIFSWEMTGRVIFQWGQFTTLHRRFEHFAQYLNFCIIVAVERECSKPTENHQTSITNRLQETLILDNKHKMTNTFTYLGKHPYWPWQITFLFFNILSVFLASSCIFVQRRMYLRWRDVKILLQGVASQAGDTDSSRAPVLISGLQGSVNVHRGALLLVPQWQCISSFVFYIQKWSGSNWPWLSKIDLDIYENLSFEILYQYEYAAQLERLHYGPITICLRKGPAHRFSRNKSKVLTEMTSREH